MTHLGLVGLFVLATGCVTQQGGDGSGNGSGSGSGSGSIEPRLGTWQYDQTTLVTNTCNSSLTTGEAGPFAIDASQATSFHIVPGDGLGSFTCSLAGASFDCPNRAVAIQDQRPTLDAVITVHLDVNGTFSDASHGAGTQQATVDCAGTQCAVVGQLPCTFSEDFAIRAL